MNISGYKIIKLLLLLNSCKAWCQLSFIVGGPRGGRGGGGDRRGGRDDGRGGGGGGNQGKMEARAGDWDCPS